MLASCLLPTFNRRAFLPRSIECFLAQDHASKELLILDDGSDCVRDLIPDDLRIRYIRLDQRRSIGAKRNLACQQASGDVILHWDDDDWHAHWRISYQVSELLNSKATISGLDRLLYYEPSSDSAWEYSYPKNNRPWVAGNTLCYRKSYWHRHRFAEVDIGEDSRFVWQAKPGEVLRHEKSGFIVATIHEKNVSRKVTSGSYWKSQPASVAHELMRATPEPPPPLQSTKPQALVAASRGIGDILRVTPLAGALHSLGYDVDLLLHPDAPSTVELLKDRPEVRNIYLRGQASAREYDSAILTTWSAGDAIHIHAKRKIIFDRNEWLGKGDTHCITKIAAQLGWQGELPPPFAAHSGREFSLLPGTVAIHPGCKPDWPWKKWHGFDELAKLLPNVVLIGTDADLRNHQTYFAREFEWPSHVQSYIGKLSLADTAALLSQCAALVSNDSGMMHLGVALGIPSLGIFGITSPQREIMRAPNMIVVTKGLECESACRAKAFGRRDCEHHLACMKTLTAQEVLERLPETVIPRKEQSLPSTLTLPPSSSVVTAPSLASPLHSPAASRSTAIAPLTVAYYGHVFDASGYGHAARAYVHALHTAGVKLTVTDLSTHSRQVCDELVESLLGEPGRADFHIFHGVPHVWAQRAFRVPNAIAMTVWETDTMPTQWSNTLNHVLEVWLPCDFNIAAFQKHVRRPMAKIPHPLMPRIEQRNGHILKQESGARPSMLGIAPGTFVFYSILEWQDRKSPSEQIVSFLRAFTGEDDTVLVLKTNPGAAATAAQTLKSAQEQTGSKARVILCAEAWSEEQIAQLHQRGDCYVSLHRGEGWGYPLFEAASAGTPVVATAYSGPLEYLDREHHQLVRFDLASVRQHYVYYHPRMKWAEPDMDDAVARLRWVFENHDAARASAREAAVGVQSRYSLDAVGRLSRTRLMNLLERTNYKRWLQLRAAEAERSSSVPQPVPVPIPADWFDADYFDHGIKSNWQQGYHWKHFEGIFRDTAGFLMTAFPEARTFFDAGCAKGFLVRSLRETGLEAWGCDISAFAIEHADKIAAPYLTSSPAEIFPWDRDYDILVALHLLPQMTEQQAISFLRHARAHITTALVAAIPLFEDDCKRDCGLGDAAHISRHNRQWWHERILEAGWHQDPLHKAMQQACQRQPLPVRMKWEIFVYSPGAR